MTGQQLRNSILQEAIHGRIVPQCSEDTPASVFYDSIQQRKKSLIREGRLKEDKVSSYIPDEDIPFDIPDSWKWVRIQDLFNVRSALRIHQTDWRHEGIPFFRGRELVQLANTGNTSPEVFISRELYEHNKAKGGVPQKNDILVSAVGTIGKVYIVQGTKEFYYKDAYILCFENFADIYPEYIKYALSSPYLQEEIHRDSMATTVAQLTIIKAKSLLIPLPPLAEQHRIVEKIEKLLPLIDEYDKAAVELETLNKILPDKLRKSVLQEAIHGTLVPNDIPEGEATGAELLQQILKERQEKENKEKGKKAKKLTLSTIEEEPWELPEGWCWCLIKDICEVKGGKRIPAGRRLSDIDTGYKYIRVSDMKNGSINTNDLKYVPIDIVESIKRYTISKDDIYITVAGTIGDVGTVPIELDGANLTENADKLVFSNTNIEKMWLYSFLRSSFIKQQIKDVTTKVGQPKLAINKIEELMLPFPPLSIQHRIVEKIEEVFSAIDKLQA